MVLSVGSSGSVKGNTSSDTGIAMSGLPEEVIRTVPE